MPPWRTITETGGPWGDLGRLCSGSVDTPPAPLWLLAVLDKAVLKVYAHSLSLSSAQVHAVVHDLVGAVHGLVATVNTRLLLDEVRSLPRKAHGGGVRGG